MPNPRTMEELRASGHRCAREDSYWVNDAQGIPLCRVCDFCKRAKLSRYRPCILTGYDQSDVDEPIEPDQDDTLDWVNHRNAEVLRVSNEEE